MLPVFKPTFQKNYTSSLKQGTYYEVQGVLIDSCVLGYNYLVIKVKDLVNLMNLDRPVNQSILKGLVGPVDADRGEI